MKGEFWRMRDSRGKPPGVMGWWPSRAVTFIDNHDTGSTQVAYSCFHRADILPIFYWDMIF